MDDLIKFIEREGGVIGIGYNKNDPNPWSVAIDFGQETPDSPISGGACYHMGTSLEDVLNAVKREVGLGG